MKATHVAFAAMAAMGGKAAVTMVSAQVVTPDQLKYQRNPATGSEIAVVMGDPSKAARTFDESKLKEYPEGSFIMEKAKVPHYQVAKTAVVFQAAAAAGPNAFNFVNPRMLVVPACSSLTGLS